jgi:large conductance mechanosensitive channel
MAQEKGLIAEFKEFLLRGNVVDLAIAVVIGGAFGTVVKAFVADLMTPIISIFAKKTNFQDLSLHIRGAKFAYGDFLNNLLSFILIAGVVFLFVVKPINFIMNRRRQAVAEGDEPVLSDEAVLLTQIRDLLASRST